MPEVVLTGTPGSGKTALLRRLELAGFAVVEEAATDVVALAQACGDEEPWNDPSFTDRVLEVQLLRAARAPAGGVVVHDRSPACTLALARHLGVTPSPALVAAAGALRPALVFFVRSLGFVRPTAVRRISHEHAVEFERVHERTYRDLGIDWVEVPPGPVAERAVQIVAAVQETIF